MVLDFIRKPSLKYRVVKCCQIIDLQISFLYHKFKCCNHDMSMSLGHPRISNVISSKLHHVKGASPPTISHDRWCSFLVYKHIVYKWLMGETTDQHVGFQSHGRQSSNDLRRVWAPPLEARPEMSQHHRGRSP